MQFRQKQIRDKVLTDSGGIAERALNHGRSLGNVFVHLGFKLVGAFAVLGQHPAEVPIVNDALKFCVPFAAIGLVVDKSGNVD